MDFKAAAKLGHYISKDYARDVFELLVNYRTISASEAASRLNLHVNTAQEFLEAMAELDILSKEQVSEGKRPYFRYSLKTQQISMQVDLSKMERKSSDGIPAMRIRERKDARARFTTGRSGQAISSVAVWTGTGRERKERRINLTTAQGKFLYHLPFPDGDPMTVAEIMTKAGVDETFSAEVVDIFELLECYGVIESPGSKT
ncbi:MAG: hypothetical protein JSW34_00795 [Candidatus Zixiibacteriota bacterium]|nr:MAG: hypothetical protein JSW34_00795 [candidate division Zixibacteria bacterium]